MRSKIIEAFGVGVLVVSTSKGAEGINVVDGSQLLVRDGVSDFVAATKERWKEPQFARTSLTVLSNLSIVTTAWNPWTRVCARS